MRYFTSGGAVMYDNQFKQKIIRGPSLFRWDSHKFKRNSGVPTRDTRDYHHGVVATADSPTNHDYQASFWGHKTAALVGDTVYLGHHNSIRSFILSTLADADPEGGKISITSPIGQALFGKHQGDIVHLMTLDGDIDYTILKII